MCDTTRNDQPQFGSGDVWATFDLEMQSTENVLELYDIQYRSKNSATCDGFDGFDGFADAWSPVWEATVEPRSPQQ